MDGTRIRSNLPGLFQKSFQIGLVKASEICFYCVFPKPRRPENRFTLARTSPHRDLPKLLRGRGAVAAATLRSQLAISPATLSREVRAASDRVLRLGAGPATHYGLAARHGGLPDRLPVFRIGPEGVVARVAELVPLDGGSWLESERGGGTPFEGLPPFIHDMAPAGYLGRRFTHHHPDLQLPDRLQDWHDGHRLIAIARRGTDCPGDLVVGEEAMDLHFKQQYSEYSSADFPALARCAGLGGAGSSAAGEQPKFASFDGERHLLVKFTPGDGSPTDQRWRDLLVCEAIASQCLREGGIAATESSIVEEGEYRYLRVERFDRTRNGRIGVLSLGALDDEYFGQRDNWSSAAERLYREGMLSTEDVRKVKLVESFAMAIGNSDRHFGNLALYCDALNPRAGCALAPVYDMVPMALAPSGGVLPPAAFPEPRRTARLLDVHDEAMVLAADFFARLAADERISKELRVAAEERPK